IAFLLKVNEAVLANKGVFRVQSNMFFDYEWKYLATSEGSYLEQEIYRTFGGYTVTARGNKGVKTRTYGIAPRSAGYEIITDGKMLENADKTAAEAIEHASAPPVGAGLKDLILTPSHAMLTIHEIVAHATEIDRIMGYEANYAGTSFVKISDVGKLKYGSKLFNVTADKTLPGGIGTIGYDDDSVWTTKCEIVCDGILVGL